MVSEEKTIQVEELRFEVNGHLIAAKAWGKPSDTPVIGLHGWLDNAATFNRLAPLLKGVRLIALDLMGHGYSDHRPASMPYYIWDNVLDVLGVADQLGLEHFEILGHSMGASIATLIAGAYPDRVSRLMLIEGIAPLVTEPKDVAEQLAQAINKRKRMQKRQQRPYASVDDAVAARISGRFPVDDEAARWLVGRGIIQRHDGFYWRSDPSLVLPSVMRLSESQVESFITRVAAPTLLVLGDKGVAQSDRRISLFPDIQSQTLKGGHHLHLEPQAAQQIAKLIQQARTNAV
ncbi:alpha/beta fold hydrolase [Amphritea sp. HPY]|uniref:alpha/beta fold hydrolase n=1 Tax=Amphritea sp. HPY TaxID=3421652 RepID=UPI003D7D8497